MQLLSRLILACFLPVLLASCTSQLSHRPASETLVVDVPHVFDLPLAGDDPIRYALAHQTFTSPVKGLSSEGVLQRLGAPSQRLNANLWIYWRYLTPEQAADDHAGCDTLVVAFSKEKVTGMKLVKTGDLQTALASGQFPHRSHPL